MAKNKRHKKGFFRPVHLKAGLFLIGYSVVSKGVFIKSVSSSNLEIAFLVPYFFGVFAGIIFLYLFNHEDFFHFMKEVEKEEENREKYFIKKYKHYGKILSSLIIAGIGGPVISALSIRFLLNNFSYKYLLIAVGNIASTILTVSLARGAISLL